MELEISFVKLIPETAEQLNIVVWLGPMNVKLLPQNVAQFMNILPPRKITDSIREDGSSNCHARKADSHWAEPRV
ncbi:uncharacterized protein PHALS_06603 [Plasmopara halstedii]|uniref:Uncharacterized protein n=1 Tax=Plasmopara halstedii TaxID=4781 RepID=A0A0N7L839_PLAHL|nr:uncharacterized protein PHALS_06603 [Plasmopara halstedii]CEG48803.1 hypothetical protein PHALS_06603 [Plasmopara halstedii]|eukprot:XP_024585172.1 hypothetical protein PHALS_06603 [Plasmopara halstedii]